MIEHIPDLRLLEAGRLIGKNILRNVVQKLIEDIIERIKIDEVRRILPICRRNALDDVIRDIL